MEQAKEREREKKKEREQSSLINKPTNALRKKRIFRDANYLKTAITNSST